MLDFEGLEVTMRRAIVIPARLCSLDLRAIVVDRTAWADLLELWAMTLGAQGVHAGVGVVGVRRIDA